MTEQPEGEDWQQSDLHIREVLALELRHRDQALERQAIEYERRLENLNNENQRILVAGARAVSNERYEGDQKALNEKLAQHDKFQTATEARNETITKEQARLRVVIIAWITIASFALAIVTAFGPHL